MREGGVHAGGVYVGGVHAGGVHVGGVHVGGFKWEGFSPIPTCALLNKFLYHSIPIPHTGPYKATCTMEYNMLKMQ